MIRRLLGVGWYVLRELESRGENVLTLSMQGFSFGIASFGILIGTPVAGAILGESSNFLGIQIFTGVLIAISMLLYIACRLKGVGIGAAKL